MQLKSDRKSQLELDSNSLGLCQFGSQDCCHGIGSTSMLPFVRANQPNARVGIKRHELPSEMRGSTYGVAENTTFGKSDNEYTREGKHVAVMPPVMAENLRTASQFGEISPLLAFKSYPIPEPHFGGNLTVCGEPLVHQNFERVNHGRMILPLEVTEEPMYVNAKQYHGILRRRQLRAKAVLEHRVVKSRKPYLHESRHRHAMRRARDCGGRFLNTKKSQPTNAKATPSNGNGTGAEVFTDTDSESSRYLNLGRIESSTGFEGFQFEGMKSTTENLPLGCHFQWNLNDNNYFQPEASNLRNF